MNYQPVIGLEVHIQLSLKSKIFAGDAVAFGAAPNSHVSPLTLGHPGTLPVLNEKAIEYAVKLGIACNCKITPVNYFARKHYFYPDLPKGFQLTQQETPVCRGGYINIFSGTQQQKRIELDHIHLEDDAGKSLHDADEKYSMIDLNRAGSALLEMVTQPVIYSANDAHAFVSAVRKLVRWINISDGNMEEGSLRCDANISLHPVGAIALGTRVEIKNINSLRFLKQALLYEIERQKKVLDSGKQVIQETRGYDSEKGITLAQRDKESAHDYRYMPEPDLPPVRISDKYIQQIKSELPELPDELFQKYIQLGIPSQDAVIITEQRELSDYYNLLIKHTSNYKAAANWLNGSIKSYLNETKTEIQNFPVEPTSLATLIHLVDSNLISNSAAHKVLLELIKHPSEDPEKIASRLDLVQSNDKDELAKLVSAIIKKHPDKLKEYKHGKKGLLGFFVGETMRESKGKADPKLLQQIVREKLDA